MQRRHVFPMHGRAITVEQAGGEQRIRSRADAAERNALRGHLAQQRDHVVVDVIAHMPAGADEQHIRHAGFGERRGRLHGDAVARARRLAVRRDDRPPVVLRAAHVVGHAQHLDRAGERDHRKVRQRQKADVREPGQRRHRPGARRGERVALHRRLNRAARPAHGAPSSRCASPTAAARAPCPAHGRSFR